MDTTDRRRKRFSFRLKPSHIIVLAFLIIILAGTFFLALPISNQNGKWLNFVDAFFMSTSAVCITGLATVPFDSTFTLFGKIIILLLVQVGGLGFMTVSTAIFGILRKRITLRDRMIVREETGNESQIGMLKLVRLIIIATFVVELFGALLLLPFFVSVEGAAGIFSALFNSVSAFCNAGFVYFSKSAFVLPDYIHNVLIILGLSFMVITGGIGVSVFLDIWRSRRNRKLTLHSKIVLFMSGALLLVGTVCFLLFEYNNDASLGNLNFFEKLMNAFFLSSMTRTGGFSMVDQSTLNPQSRMLTMLFMLIGGAPGSTGGGIKITTFAALIFVAVAGIKGNTTITIGKNNIPIRAALKAVGVVLLMLLMISIMTMIIMIVDGSAIQNSEAILFECVSAASTTGLSMGITQSLSWVSKLVVVFGMFLGRLGPITVGLLFLSRRKQDAVLNYPDGHIMIG